MRVAQLGEAKPCVAGMRNVVKALKGRRLRPAAIWFIARAKCEGRATRRRAPEGRIRIMLSKDDILAALAAVAGPDGKTPLNQSGAIDGVTIRDGKVFVAIRVHPARARELEAMRGAAEARIKALPGVASALVTLTAESEGAPA